MSTMLMARRGQGQDGLAQCVAYGKYCEKKGLVRDKGAPLVILSIAVPVEHVRLWPENHRILLQNIMTQPTLT